MVEEKRGSGRLAARAAVALASGLGLCALLPAGASADTCDLDTLDPFETGSNTGPALFDSGGYEWDVTLAGAAGPDRNQPFATFKDGGSNGPGGTPPGPRAQTDSYDDWGALFVGGDGLGNLYHSTDDDSCAREEGDREVVFRQLVIGGLQVQRKIFVPATGMPGARILNLITNPGTAPVTTSVQVGDVLSEENHGDLGSDNLTAVRSSSSGDAAFTPEDFWGVTSDHFFGTTNGDLALAHVIDGPGGADRVDFVTLTGISGDPNNSPEENLMWRWDDVTIPPGQTAAFMFFEVQQGVPGADAATEDANAAAQAQTYQTADPSVIYAGMSPAEISALRNWSDLEIQFSFEAALKQKLKKLAVSTTCPEEACTVALSGQAKAKPPGKGAKSAQASKKAKKFKVATPNTDVTAGQTATIPVDLAKEGKLRKLLKADAKAKLKLTAQATDGAGSTATDAAQIKLK